VVAAVKAVLVGACAGGLVLRLIGLQYGLPHVYNPDEVAIMTRALSFAKGTLNPGNFLYPTLFFYVLFGWVGAYLALVWISGRVRSLAELQLLYFTDPTGIYTAGRLLGVAAGTATIAAVYRLAQQVADSRVAAAAAVFMATAPLNVRDSHYVKHDVPATLTIVLAYVAMLRVRPETPDERTARRHEWTAAALCGVAFATHYYCVFLAIPLVVVVIAATRSRGLGMVVRRCAFVTAVSLAVFLLLSPYIALEPTTAWRDIIANRAIVVDRAVAQGAFAPVLRYLEMLVRDTTGLPVLLLAALGIVGMLRHQPSRALLLLSFPVSFFLFIANTFPASRYLNPIVPFVALFAAYGASVATRALSPKPALFWLLAAGAAAPAVYQSLRTDLFIRQTDTRTIGLAFVEANVPPGSTIALQPYSTPLEPTRESLVAALDRNLGRNVDVPPKFRLQLSREPWPTPAYNLVYLGMGLDPEKAYVDYRELGGDAALAALRRHDVAYVVVKRYNKSDPETLPFLTALAREGRRLATVQPYRPGTSETDAAAIEPFLHNTDTRIDAALERPGPVLEIWQINDR
jgi:hypothetical protein